MKPNGSLRRVPESPENVCGSYPGGPEYDNLEVGSSNLCFKKLLSGVSGSWNHRTDKASKGRQAVVWFLDIMALRMRGGNFELPDFISHTENDLLYLFQLT